MGIVLEGPFVFIIPGCKVPATLAYVRFPTVRTGLFVNAEACEFVVVLLLRVSRLCSVLFVRKAICRLECLNKFATCLVSFSSVCEGEPFVFFFWEEEWVVSFGGVKCVRGDREGVVKEDIMDDVFFSLVFFCVEVVGV